jgi:hypothetical protein
MKLQFAIAAFLILLGAVELVEWLKARSLPFPVLVLGGAVLSVVSNYSKLPIDRLLSRLPNGLIDESVPTSDGE